MTTTASFARSIVQSPPPPSLEDEGNSFINNGGDDTGDLAPDQVSQEAFGDQTDYDKHAPKTTTTKPKAEVKAATKPAAKKGAGCEVRIVLKCGGELIKNRPGSFLYEGVSYSKNTNNTGELVESLPCGSKPAGKKFFLRFSEFNTEITFDKIPYSIDIPKGQCL